MLTTKKSKESSFSFSKEKFMLGSLDDKYSLTLSAWSGDQKRAKMASKERL